jgi:predicted dehydrogenase
MNISPYILGSGKAALALTEALRVVEITNPDLRFNAFVKIPRNHSFPDVKKINFPILLIANPHALHEKAIEEGEKAGFKCIICEKPAAVSLEQIEKLKKITTPVALCHVYRQMWGLQTLKEMVLQNEFGKIISIEGRYWQSSSAEKARLGQKTQSWKNNVSLSGESDVLFDIGSHWVDAVLYLTNEKPQKVNLWKSFVNAESSHRDTHVHIMMEFSNDIRALGSVSKTVHGATNEFEIAVIGEKKFASWNFLRPDVLEVSEGTTKTFISRNKLHIGSGHWPHHGLGWIEGYVEIIKQALRGGSYPTLKEGLSVMEILLENK